MSRRHSTSPTSVLVAALLLTGLIGCTEFAEQLTEAEFQSLVRLQPGSCTSSCGGRFPATTFLPDAGWDFQKARPIGGALVLEDGGEATLAGPTFEGEGRLELVVDVDASEGTLVVGFEVGGLAGERGAWGAFDVATGEARGVHASVLSTETTAALAWTPGDPITVEVKVDCAGVHLRVGEEQIELDTSARFEADRVFVRWTGKGQVAISSMAMESECAAPWEPICAQACTGGAECEIAVCTALGVCAVVAASESVACNDDDPCTIDDRCLTTGCAGTVNECDDGDACTTDRCDLNDGACISAPIPGCVPPSDGWSAARRIYPVPAQSGGGDGPAEERDDVLLELPLQTLASDRLVLALPLDGGFDGVLPGEVTVQDFGSVFVDGRFGKALEPTAASRIELRSPQASFSMMAWVRPNRETLTNTAAFGFFPPPGEGSQITMRLRNGEWTFEAGGDPIVLGAVSGQWQHLAMSWNEAAQAGFVALDGEIVGRFDDVDQPANALLLLGDPVSKGSSRVWVDELAYFERAVSPVELRALSTLRVPMGSAPFTGVTLQPDYDDIRVRVDETVIPHDVVGRRPHGDSGLPAANVHRSWRFDGSLDAAIGEAASRGEGLSFAPGVFGDAGGALAPSDGVELWIDRTDAIAPPFTVEVWVQLTAATDDCNDAYDGASIVEAISEDPSDRGGLLLRVCDVTAQLALLGAAQNQVIESEVALEDDGWHHLVASVGTDETVLFVDGLAQGAMPTPAKSALPAVSLSVLRGQHGAAPSPTAARVDELIVHRVALEAGAVLARVTPVVPVARILTDVRRAQGGFEPVTLELGRADWTWRAPAPGCLSVNGACQGGVYDWVPSDWLLEEPERFLAVDRTGSGAMLSFTSRGGFNGSAEGRLGMPLDRGSAEGTALLPDAWTVEAAVLIDTVSDGRLLTLVAESGEPIWTLELAGSRLRVRSDDATSTLDDVVVPVGSPLVLGATYDGANLSAFLEADDAPAMTAVFAPPGRATFHVGPLMQGGDETPIAGSLFQVRVSDFVRPAASRLGIRLGVRLD